MKHRVFAAGICAAMLCGILTGCRQAQKPVEREELPILNYTAPETGDPIVCFHIRDYGDVRIRLFQDAFPKECEEFLAFTRNGSFDGTSFCRVIAYYGIEAGSPGMDSTEGSVFNSSKNRQLIHVPGAVGYGNGAPNSGRFFIVTGKPISKEYLDDMIYNGDIVTDAAREMYMQYGGTPWLDGYCTVFGQVIDGLDVAYAISHVPVDQETKEPIPAVYIESVTVEQYDGSEIRWYPADYGLQ